MENVIHNSTKATTVYMSTLFSPLPPVKVTLTGRSVGLAVVRPHFHFDLIASNLIIDGRQVLWREVLAVVDAPVHADVLLLRHLLTLFDLQHITQTLCLICNIAQTLCLICNI